MTNCASIVIMTLFIAYLIQMMVARHVSSQSYTADDDQLTEAIGNSQ